VPEERLVALPVQFVQVPDGIILKRGLEELMVFGKSKAAAVTRVLAEAGSESGSRLSDLRELVESNWRDVDANALIAELREKKLLVEPAERAAGPESSEQLLAWSLVRSAKRSNAGFNQVTITVIGVNSVSRRLIESLDSVGAAVVAVDHPEFRNVRLFTADEQLISEAWGTLKPQPHTTWKASAGDRVSRMTCLVVCSDFGGLQQLADWNKYAYERGWSFLPVVLQNGIGLVGPFVFPDGTACFQCMLDREDANTQVSALRRAPQAFAFEGQSIAAYHPSMASALGDVAAIELTKHFRYGWTSAAVDNVIELNLLAASMKTRPILKSPSCEVCSPLNARGLMRFSSR
jgi:molybdopterin-synthase adenylyltransferase